ncbi:hypothetical protein AB1484_36515 [Parafrankia sp. FMc6]|uniref:hypothetical protein n=1 Tax=Parafrankia soli TaxID=2599596 RepID=UPI0034D62720
MIIKYNGMICFGETDYDGGSNSDEIYLVTTVTTYEAAWLGNGQKKPTVRSALVGVYDDVDAGETYPDSSILYIGNIQDMTFAATCMEQDYGDPNALKTQIQQVAQAAADAGHAAGYDVPSWAPGLVATIGSALLGTGDDPLGTDSKVFTAADLQAMLNQPTQHERGLAYHFFTFHNGEGSTYKFYFELIR